MSLSSAYSVYGGAGGKGVRKSVSSLEGLRNMLRNDEPDSAPSAPTPAAPVNTPPATAPVAVPRDDKQTLQGLNNRLSGYLDRVRDLQKENHDLQKEIDDILAKRKTLEGRDWEEVQKPLDDLKKKIKDIATDNAKSLLQADNIKLANEDFKNKLRDEVKARKELEKDLEDLRRVHNNTKLNCEQTQQEIGLVKDDLSQLEKEHKEEVDTLCEKIKNSEVKVVIDSQQSKLSDIISNIREQYDKLAQESLQETEDWYKSKFEDIKVEEAQNTEALQSGKMELKELLREKQTLQIQINAAKNRICNLEETLQSVKAEYYHRMAPANQLVLKLESELREVRAQVEQQVETNRDLVCVKMKLEAEINSYQELISAIPTDASSSETV
ncbi:keratin, type I cytoskeletal 18-like isoform 2-T2 [Pholidichthys leucotaenia]